jgi:hypothetical protein
MLDIKTGTIIAKLSYEFTRLPNLTCIYFSGWGGGPINWHNYKELDAQFDYIKVRTTTN